MNCKQKSIISGFLVAVVCFVLISSHSFGLVWVNNTESAYCEPCTEKREAIGSSIMDGASCFLRAYAGFLLFMNEIEVSGKEGLNYAGMSITLENVRNEMEELKNGYGILIKDAAITPYNPSIIEQLKTFNYIEFQEKNALNPVIFGEVGSYLIKGDVTGIYKRILSDSERITAVIKGIKEGIDNSIQPSIMQVWQLNHDFSNMLLFGQYLSMVFGELN